MEYQELVNLYQKLESTDSDLEKTEYLANFYDEKRENLSEVVLLSYGRLFPSWKNMDLGVSSKTVVKVIKTATGREEDEIREEWKKTGDLGTAAKKMSRNKKQTRLVQKNVTVEDLNNTLESVATEKKSGLSETVDQDKKIKELANLLSAATPEQAQYITRTYLRNLRLGVAEGTVRDALDEAFFDKPMKEKIQRKIDVTNDMIEVAEACKKGEESLNKLELKLFRPINSMLAKNVNSVEEGFEEVGRPAAIDFKYDGMRCQVHKKKDKVELYTRRLENVTKQFPEVANYVKENVSADEIILDSEIVGRNLKTGDTIPFQKLSRRIKRKYDIQRMKDKIPVVLRPFDILMKDGQVLIDENYSSRWKKLESSITERTDQLELVDHDTTESTERVKELRSKSKERGHEGLMMKNLEAGYKPGSRVGYMVKIKSTMETLDLAVTEAKWSEGRRSGWLGRLKVSCKDKESSKHKSVGQVSTGLTDEELEKITGYLEKKILNEDGRRVTLKPDLVVEVEFEEIQKSPEYSSGYALRFPRVKNIRWEKESADSLNKVQSLYDQQN